MRSIWGPSANPSVPDHVSVWDHPSDPPAFRSVRHLRPMRLLRECTDRWPARRRDIDMICVRENSEANTRGRRTAVRGHRARSRRADCVFTRSRGRANRALAFGSRVAPPAAAARERHEIERDAAHDGAMGRGGGSRRNGIPDGRVAQVSRGRARGAHGDRPGEPRRHRGLQPVRRHPDRLGRRGLRQPGRGAGRESEPGAPPSSVSSRSTARRPILPAAASPSLAHLAGALMLDHLGLPAAHDRIVAAIARCLAGTAPVPRSGWPRDHEDVTNAVIEALKLPVERYVISPSPLSRCRSVAQLVLRNRERGFVKNVFQRTNV